MSDLASRDCVRAKQGDSPLGGDRIRDLLGQLRGGWRAVDDHHLTCEYPFPDFASALAFTNRLGELAEEQDHHPDIHLSWGSVKVDVWTHVVDGLTESDFVWAAKADRLR